MSENQMDNGDMQRNRRASDSEMTEVIAHLTAFQEQHMRTHDNMLRIGYTPDRTFLNC